eukprot:6647600-Pyramimonas_sp.AAC.1
MHNYGISAEELERLCLVLDTAQAWAPSAPCDRMVVIQGDFNFGNDYALHVQRPERAVAVGPRNHRMQVTRWMRSLGRFMEVASNAATHCTSSSNSLSVIAGFFFSVPGWM